MFFRCSLGGIFSLSGALFEQALQRGVAKAWIESESEAIADLGLSYLRMHEARFSAFVAALLKGFKGNQAWRQRLVWFKQLIDLNGSREMFDFFLALIEDGTLDEARGMVAVNSTFWSLVSCSRRSSSGESRVAATTRGLGSTPSAAQILEWGPILLDFAPSLLVRVAKVVDPGATGYGRSLASSRVQTVLEMDFAAQSSRGQKVNEQGYPRAHLPDGCGESDVGRAANPWRTPNARLRHLRANRVAPDAESPRRS